MTETETKAVLAVLRASYPSFYAGMSRNELIPIVNLWHEMFADDSYGEVSAAVKALISTRVEGYPPTIGAVKDKLAMLKNVGSLDEDAAWAMVSKACANGIYGYRKEFDKLPEEVQAVVGAAEVIREWAMMDVETFQSVIASNFKKSYRAKAVKRRQLDMLPGDIRRSISAVADRMKMGKESHELYGLPGETGNFSP